jgi:hypothetical protein
MRVSRLVLQIATAALLLTPITTVRAGRAGPIYKISLNEVERSTQVIDYSHRQGTTKLEFRGTELMPDARGEIAVESRNGSVEIRTEIKELTPASFFGSASLTYVLWAIMPDGRTMNVSEVLLDQTNKSKFAVATNLQAFSLIVTAEPYFAVTQPSDVVVLESCWRPDQGISEHVSVSYQLLERGQYLANVPALELRTIFTEQIETLDLSEARNALRIAWWSNASIYAPESYAKAKELLAKAEVNPERYHDCSSIAARAAVVAAEDARSLAIMRQAGTARGNRSTLVSSK